VETLRDGSRCEIRPFRPEDRAGIVSAASRISPRSIYRRFFAPKRTFSEQEKAFFFNVDFDKHVAVVALVEEAGRQVIVGAARYVIIQPGKAEIAFTVIDQYQGKGVGAAMMRRLIEMGRAAGIETFTAEVLQENRPMLRVFEKSGLPMTTSMGSGVVHVDLQLRRVACGRRRAIVRNYTDRRLSFNAMEAHYDDARSSQCHVTGSP
jgi:RimJ/RimL family protein N-acetyltransferase